MVLGKIGFCKFQVGVCQGIGVPRRDWCSCKMKLQVGACRGIGVPHKDSCSYKMSLQVGAC